MAKERQLKEGDLVQLRSGGPLMTVFCFNSEEQGELDAECGWFVDERAAILNRVNIPVQALKPVASPDTKNKLTVEVEGVDY